MKRKIFQELVEWKNKEQGRSAILIDGARRVGKSYIAKAFAKQHYKSYILIDFSVVAHDIIDLFETHLNNLDTLFVYLEQYYHCKLYERESLLIFDEIQFCPRVRSAIKHLVADGRYDYLETGSLMSIRAHVKDILIPSEEQHITMYPMDFEEFLWALGEESFMDIIRDSYTNLKALPASLHRQAMHYFRLYMIVGGMPQVVSRYRESNDFEDVDRAKRNILVLYRGDIAKHAHGAELKVREIFDDIPSQLSRQDKKFRVSALREGAKTRDYEDALFWLDDAMIVNHCYKTTAPNVGLRMNMQRSALKCYMADTGLLISHAFDEKGLVSSELYKKLLLDKLEVNKGMFVENIVAQMLLAAGYKLYFYRNSSRDDASQRMEIDFLIQKSGINNRHNIIPIEVKSGKNYTLSSLKKCKLKFNQYVDRPVVLHSSELKLVDGILYLPLYMTPLL